MKVCEDTCERKLNPSQKNKLNYYKAQELWECKSACGKKKQNTNNKKINRKKSHKKKSHRKKSHRKIIRRSSKRSFFNFF